MDRFTTISDDIDFRAKTAATLARCIAAKQWQNVAAIGGFRSVHDARVMHDTEYMKGVEASKPAPVPASGVTYCPRTGARITPASRDWAENIKCRVRALDMTMEEFSISLGFTKSYAANALSAMGHMGAKAARRIDNHLRALESNARAAA